jgi:hypothetical protein
MYIVNLEEMGLSEDRIFKCNGVIANYLIETCGVPALGEMENGTHVFMKTELLDKCLEMMPFYYKIYIKFT